MEAFIAITLIGGVVFALIRCPVQRQQKPTSLMESRIHV